MASESTKLQVNFKLADGTLINLYADSRGELSQLLAHIDDLSADINKASKALAGQGAVSTIQERLGGTVVSTGIAPVQTNTVTHSPLELPINKCKHGERTFRESKPGAPKAWKGYFCPTPKGTPDQCEPNFSK